MKINYGLPRRYRISGASLGRSWSTSPGVLASAMAVLDRLLVAGAGEVGE